MGPEILRRANLSVRSKRPFYSNETACEIFCTVDLMELCFLSGRCSRDKQGSCIMCDYGSLPGTFPIGTYLSEMERALSGIAQPINTVLLSTNGSFFDEHQISTELLQEILKRIGQSNIPIVEIETHYMDVTASKLRLLQQFLPDKEVILEMGLETIDPSYQREIIMKDIDLLSFERTVSLISEYGFGIDTNIVVGLPFLSPKKQFQDAKNTIQWSFEHGCRPVLFPINIKPYTLLMDAYHGGFYQPLSAWMLPILLDTLPEEWLAQITVTWYGNREDVYEVDGDRAIFPTACPACSQSIREFYDELQTIKDGSIRKKRLRQLISQTSCRCLVQARTEITHNSCDSYENQYASFLTWLGKQRYF